MTDVSGLRLASLLASRLCHDLVGPLGAVSNGLELIAEDDAMAKEALSLAQRSAKRAANRLQFFRYAFGAAGGEPNFGPAEAKALAFNLLQSSETVIDWPELAAVELPTGAGRLVLNLLLLASECLPRGGSIRIGLAANRITADATGSQARLSAETKSAIAGAIPPAALTARTIVGYFVAQLSASLGGRLEITDEGVGKVRLQVTFTGGRNS